jgi:hypothetical protein
MNKDTGDLIFILIALELGIFIGTSFNQSMIERDFKMIASQKVDITKNQYIEIDIKIPFYKGEVDLKSIR